MKSFIHTVLILLVTTLIAPKSTAQILDIQEITSPKGVKAWLVEDHSVPIIAVQFGFNHGSAHNAAEQQGLTQLLSNTLDEGAGPYDAKEFQKRLNDRSITLKFSASRDALTGNLKTLVKHKVEAFSLLKSALTAPRFEDEAIERMKDANTARLKRSLSDPNWIAARLLYDKGFGDHPYALNSGGTLTSLEKLTSNDLRNVTRETLTRDVLHISVTGAINSEELSLVLDLIFSDLPETIEDFQRTETPLATAQNLDTIFVYNTPSEQTFIEMVWPGVTEKDPRYHTAIVLNHILGGSGFGSLLTEDIREKHGLTYGIYSQLQPFDKGGLFTISTSTAHKNTGEILKRTHTIIKDLKTKGVTDEQLMAAKDYLIGSMPLRFTSSDNIAKLLSGLQARDLGIDFFDRFETLISAVTIEDIKTLANELFTQAPMTILVGQPKGIDNAKTTILENVPNAE